MMDKLTIYLQNARSIRGKTLQFRLGLLTLDYDVLAITETWLTDGVFDGEVSDERYDVHRCDRDPVSTNCTRGGGVMLLTKSSLAAQRDPPPSAPLSAAEPFDSVHVVLTAQHINSKVDLHVICVYVPGTRVASSDLILDRVTIFLNELCGLFPNDNFLVLGDFNMPYIQWEYSAADGFLAPSSGSLGDSVRHFLDFLNISHLNQYNAIANGNGRFLDLVLSNTYISVRRVSQPIVTEDMPHHPAICLEVQDLKVTPMRDPIGKRFAYSKGDYESICSLLGVTDWNSVFDSLSMDDATELFNSKLHEAINLHIPSYYTTSRKYPIWFSKCLIKIIKEKNKFHKRWKIYGNPRDYDTFSLLRRRQRGIQSGCWVKYIRQNENAISKNPKSFWKYARDLRGVSNIPKQLSYEGRQLTDIKSISEGFLSYFQSVYVKSNNNVTPNSQMGNLPQRIVDVGKIHVNKDLVLKYLNRVNINQSAGSDQISPIVVRNCARALADPLAALYEKSLREGIFPGKWKEALVVPIHKNGPKTDVERYRPISILPVFGKILELIVYDQLYPSLQNIIPDCQHGFMRRRGVVSNLAVFTDDVIAHMDKGTQVDVIYTDYSKCFDRLNHDILVDKLRSKGISGDLLRWLTCYLKNRSQAVKIGQYCSPFSSIPSGVAQGSHLGPLLFNLYMCDLSGLFRKANIIMYADDQKIYLPIKGPTDCLMLQEDLDRLSDYCLMNGLDINISKCQLITFTRNKNPILFSYRLNGSEVPRVSKVRDLGVMLDTGLTFTDHYDHIVWKAYRMLGFVIRVTKPFTLLTPLIALYCAYVRSLLEYASPIWSPNYAVHKNRIEAIQRRFLNVLRCREVGHNILTNCESTRNLMTLSNRRDIADTMFIFDIINGVLDCPALVERVRLRVPNPRLRQRHITFFEPRLNSNYARNSILHRCCHTYDKIFAGIDIFQYGSDKQKFKTLIREVLNTSVEVK